MDLLQIQNRNRIGKSPIPPQHLAAEAPAGDDISDDAESEHQQPANEGQYRTFSYPGNIIAKFQKDEEGKQVHQGEGGTGQMETADRLGGSHLR